jgi:hypothetical protein
VAVTGDILPKRTRYYGSRSGDPSSVGLEQGAWWYRSDLHVWKWWDGLNFNYLPLHDVTITQDFKKSGAGAGAVNGTITATGLTGIIFVVHLEVTAMKPVAEYQVFSPIHWTTGFNTIGVTVGVSASTAGCTITLEALFLGYR